MVSRDRYKKDFVRIRIVLGAMLLALIFLGVTLWRIQVRNSSRYQSSMERQSIRRVRLPGVRGRLFDRHGACLAENRPSYCIAIYVEELRQPGRWGRTIERVDKVVDSLSQTLDLERQVSYEDIESHVKRRLPLPFLAWRDIDHAALARLAESADSYPGVDVYIEPVRVYPRGSLACHVLGYVGRASDEQTAGEPYHYYTPEMEGKYGVERAWNDELSGEAGGRLIRVDASGFKYADMPDREPKSGEDIYLTIDSKIQEVAEEILIGRRGAVVVLDTRNGDVLAMASSPVFDQNDFTPRVSAEAWSRIVSDKGKPFFNRALQGTYPPGSTFKPMVALTALVNRRATEQTMFACPGYFDLGGVRFNCWRHRGHGHINMRKAIEQSCNPYFCQLGLQCGYERIYHMADAVGFGHRTGIELPAEAEGLLPDEAWKIARMGEGWRGGDTCNVSIGQGALLVTPLQMAQFVAAIANGGMIYRPRLRGGSNVSGELVNRMAWSEQNLRVVRGGMHDVIHNENATGVRALVPGLTMGGKTGTAEYGPKSQRRKYAWMIIFAPYDQPRYAAAMVIEDAISGGITVAPRMKQLMESIFQG